jgi:hypothetical protein
MKKVLKVIGVIAALFVGWLAYMGMFNAVEVIDGQEGGYKLGGIWHHGSYGLIGRTFEGLVEMADKADLEDYRMMSVYLNKPGEVSEDSLLTFVGVVLKEGMPEGEGWNRLDIPRGDAVYTDFVYRNSMSYGFGAAKCFPVMFEKSQEKGWKDLIGCEYYEGHDYTRYILIKGNPEKLR